MSFHHGQEKKELVLPHEEEWKREKEITLILITFQKTHYNYTFIDHLSVCLSAMGVGAVETAQTLETQRPETLPPINDLSEVHFSQLNTRDQSE